MISDMDEIVELMKSKIKSSHSQELITFIEQVGQNYVGIYCLKQEEYFIQISDPDLTKLIQKMRIRKQELRSYYFIYDDIQIFVRYATSIWHMYCIQKNQNLFWYALENWQIFGIIKSLLIGIRASQNQMKLQSLVKINFGASFVQRRIIRPIADVYSQLIFDTTLIILQFNVTQGCFLFLRNNRSINTYFRSECIDPFYNFNHNKNYYMFGFRESHSVMFFVRKHSNLKQIRNHRSGSAYSLEPHKCLYIGDNKGLSQPICLFDSSYFRCLNSRQKEPIQQMQSPKKAKCLVFSFKNVVYQVSYPLEYKIKV